MITILLCLFSALALFQVPETPPVIRTCGVRIDVPDMDKAIEFYCEKLGFRHTRGDGKTFAELRAGDSTRIFLKSNKQAASSIPGEAKSKITLQVNDLDEAIGRAKRAGISFAEQTPRNEAIGRAISITDPFGTVISLMHVTVRPSPVFKEPRLYNYGFETNNMEQSRSFYCGLLGFHVMTEKYLPLDLPLTNTDKSFGFMIHFREWIKPATRQGSVALVFQCDDLSQVRKYFASVGIKHTDSDGFPAPAMTFIDPSGVAAHIMEIK